MDGLQEINQMMIDMRENPLKEINGQRVIMLEDYQLYRKNLLDGSELRFYSKIECVDLLH
jgi:hypothetical protein